MREKKVCDPAWWRLGWIPYLVLPMVAAAADLCFTIVETEGMKHLGVGAGAGIVLFMAALLLLRRDFTRREQVFLVLLALLSVLGLFFSGSHVSCLIALVLPFFVIIFGPGKPVPVEQGVVYRNWWHFWRDHRPHVKGGVLREMFPLLISLVVGVLCFVIFLCIFAAGNPVVQQVWAGIASCWNKLMSYLQISLDFWRYAIMWGLGIVAFGFYTVQRPPSDVTRLPEEEPAACAPAGRSLLPHLPLTILLGVNLAFLIATGTDIAFLWFQRVPEGVSQTEYLYEGAGSITWASILAACLLGYFFRRRGSVRRTLVARGLGYALAGQTLLLAVSVYLRLHYQIMAYSFTPRRIVALEFLLLGVAGLVILLCYMSCRGGFLRYIRICAGVLILMGLCFAISRPAALSGDMNLRCAASHPEWKFSIRDFKHDCFDVRANLAFAQYVYEKERKTTAALTCPVAREEAERSLYGFANQLKIAALALERRSSQWRCFTLRDYWDRRAAEHILGRPIGRPEIEPVH